MFQMFSCVLCLLMLTVPVGAEDKPDERFPLFKSLSASPAPHFIAYTPSELDPRNEANQARVKTSSFRADLEALRPNFDGLVLYGYHPQATPRIVALAKELEYTGLLLAIWDPKSTNEIEGVIDLARLYEGDFAIGVIVGNEGITFNRYELDDLKIAGDRCRAKLPATIPITTSEPLVGYKHEFIREFGDFLAPNIHPVFDASGLGPADAAQWARERAAELASRTGRPVFLKETGFPHAGKPAYTLETQRAYWEAYRAPGLLARNPDKPGVWQFHGVAFEAFDLPWKSEESKLEIEKSWGLLNEKRQPHPAFNTWKR